MKNLPMVTGVKTFLVSIGLSDKEAELYLASLKMGPQTVSTLSTKTGIARSTVSFVFGELINRGVASKQIKNHSTYFSVFPPEMLEPILLQRQAEAKKQLNDFKDFLPYLSGLQSRQLVPKVQYFQGLESLCRTVDNCCASDETVLFISSHLNMHPKIREYIEDVYIPKSRDHKNKNKVIMSDGPASREYYKKAKGVYDEAIFVPPQKNPFKLTMAIHGDSVDFISYDPSDLSGVVIENRFIADHMRAVFDIVKEHLTTAL
jgi:sugar-specific transcriptional regulator TrmB